MGVCCAESRPELRILPEEFTGFQASEPQVAIYTVEKKRAHWPSALYNVFIERIVIKTYRGLLTAQK